MKRWLPILGLLMILVIDRVVKFMARNGLDLTIGPVQLTQFRNDGLIFSVPAPYWMTVALMLIAGVVIVIVAWRQRRRFQTWWPVGLMLIGAVSNLYDRLAYGYIVDYIYLSRWWPIFNLADLMLTAGIIWFVLIMRAESALSKAQV